jgi:hypothetical protein
MEVYRPIHVYKLLGEMIKPYMQDMHTLYMFQHVSTRMTETRARWMEQG